MGTSWKLAGAFRGNFHDRLQRMVFPGEIKNGTSRSISHGYFYPHSSPDPIDAVEKIVGEPRKGRNMSPSTVCNTEEPENSSRRPDFHSINIEPESPPSLPAVELQTPGPNNPSGLTSGLHQLRADIVAALFLAMNFAARFSHSSANLGKMIVTLTFQAGVSLVIPLSLQIPSPAEQFHTPWTLYVLLLALVIAFAASFMGILLRESCPPMASKMEKAGCLSLALGFFVMMSMFLPHKVTWIGWIAFALPLVAFTLAKFKSHGRGLDTP